MFSLGPEGLTPSLPDHSKPKRLYCLNGGYHLQILPDGTVHGNREDHDIYSVLRIRAVSAGVVVLQGVEAQRYLAMNDDGRAYGSPVLNDECYFLERMEENHYNTYMSQQYQGHGWYVAIKKNGKLKLGPRTHVSQKAVCFLPRTPDSPGE